MKTQFCVSLCIALLTLVSSTLADDLQPPTWRGGPLSTVAEWDFLTPGAGPPDGTSVVAVVGNSGGIPTASQSAGITWSVFDGTGAWTGDAGTNGGSIDFSIPNWIDTEPWKLIWIQMTYQPGPVIGGPSVTNIVANDPQGISGIQFLGANEFPIIGNLSMIQRIEQWQIFPNPDNERITIFIPPTVALSQVVIDTISVPEPSSLTLASAAAVLGWVGVWRRRRARRS